MSQNGLRPLSNNKIKPTPAYPSKISTSPPPQAPTPQPATVTDINTLLFGNAPNPDPYTVVLPNFEQTKCSVRKNGVISGYAANTN